jgi:hypoxanthine phosphoribosyltransferase
MDGPRGEPPEGQPEEEPRRRRGRRGVSGAPATQQPSLKSDTVRFAHASERQFAQLLDFYQIDWEYEPTSFDLEWDKDGAVVQRFTPDFYLPQYDLYIEITTLNQRLVTKKNRKVRRLRELYPGVNCKIFYQRDYLSLVSKYGLEDLAGGEG